MGYDVFMTKKLGNTGIARAAKYVKRQIDNGEDRRQALDRGRKLAEAGRLSKAGTIIPAHPDDEHITT
tara:strand:- start:4225 stop:4428 length:204 start_codon:yes stop_codon:yes gene_type:complete